MRVDESDLLMTLTVGSDEAMRVSYESSGDLESWNEMTEGSDYEIESDVPNADGTHSVTLRISKTAMDVPMFVRVRVALR
jgi:hypothetical protein